MWSLQILKKFSRIVWNLEALKKFSKNMCNLQILEKIGKNVWNLHVLKKTSKNVWNQHILEKTGFNFLPKIIKKHNIICASEFCDHNEEVLTQITPAQSSDDYLICLVFTSKYGLELFQFFFVEAIMFVPGVIQKNSFWKEEGNKQDFGNWYKVYVWRIRAICKIQEKLSETINEIIYKCQ